MVCKRCNGSGIDPERIERVFYTKDGDVDVGYDPQLCRDCYVSKYLEFSMQFFGKTKYNTPFKFKNLFDNFKILPRSNEFEVKFKTNDKDN